MILAREVVAGNTFEMARQSESSALLVHHVVGEEVVVGIDLDPLRLEG